ncbi:hypothetical protein ACIA58_31415 [Kribbella sp. NPDC051586]|uniref:hypothetical protein n=1 Tax=Kribbella sp. NPDC051586 TaxID=3364118 RepID=UPI0037996FE6
MPGLPRRDLLATLLMVALLAVHLPFVAIGNRAGGCLSLLLIGAAILVLAPALRPDPAGWLITFLAVASTTTGALVIALPTSVVLATISVAAAVVLWSVSLAEHLTFSTPEEPHDDPVGSTAAARR